MSAEPLTRKERENLLRDDQFSRLHPVRMDEYRRYDATVRAAEERADALRDALLYLIGHDIAGREGYVRVNEVCLKALAADDAARNSA